MPPVNGTQISFPGNTQLEGRQLGMDFAPLVIHSVKTAAHGRICASHMIAVVGKLLARFDPGGFADNFVSLDYEVGAIGVGNDPFAAQQSDRVIGSVADRDKVDKGMRFVSRQAAAAMVVAELVEIGRQARQFGGARHK